jgi:hypothetical protein
VNGLGEKGVPVSDGFQYSSDRNDAWLEGDKLTQMIVSAEIEV